MARIELKGLAVGVVMDHAGNVLSNVAFTSSGTLYAAATGATTLTGPALVSNASGELPGWLDPGIYTITVGLKPVTFEVGAGGGVAAPDASTTVKGIIQLAGDLAGTAASPTVAGLADRAPKASPTFTGTVTVPVAVNPAAAAQKSSVDLVDAAARKYFPVPTGGDDAAELVSRLNAGERDVAMRALTYNFTQAVAPTAGSAPVAIRGEGIERTRIRKTVDGDAFRLDTSGTVTIEGMTIKADVPSGGIMTSGAAIKVGPTPTAQSPYPRPSVVVHDVLFDSVAAGSVFKYGVHCTNGYETRFDNVQGQVNVGFLLTTSAAGSGARGPHKFIGCSIYSALYGLQIVSTTIPGIEGVQVIDCDFVGCFHEIHAVNSAVGSYFPPQIQVVGGHSNCSVSNFHVERWAQIQISDCLMYNNGTDCFFDFTDVSMFTIRGNQCFAVAGGDPDWMQITLASTGSGPGMIHGNYVALGPTPKKPFRISTEFAWLNSIVSDNKFTDSAGNVITSLVTMTAGTLSPSVVLRDNPARAWAAQTLLNSWTNNTGYQAARASRNGEIVRIEGNITGGTTTAATVLFTLPVGMRPPNSRRFAVEGNFAYGSVQVTPAGDVMILTGGNAALSLDGISFSVDG